MNIQPQTRQAGIQAFTAAIAFLTSLRDDLAASTAMAVLPATPTSSAPVTMPPLPPASGNGKQAARPKDAYNLAKYDLSKFAPVFKVGRRLSEEGIEAMCHAIMLGLSAKRIGAIFKTKSKATYAYRQRLEGKLAWNYNSVPLWL